MSCWLRKGSCKAVVRLPAGYASSFAAAAADFEDGLLFLRLPRAACALDLFRPRGLLAGGVGPEECSSGVSWLCGVSCGMKYWEKLGPWRSIFSSCSNCWFVDELL